MESKARSQLQEGEAQPLGDANEHGWHQPWRGKGLWHGRRCRAGAVSVHPRTQAAPASPGCRLARVLVPNRMLAPCRCCPRYTSRWLFTAPLLGDRLVFILVIWQRRSGTDESGAGRSCFATFSLPHCRGFPKTAFPHAAPAACPGGLWSLVCRE